MPQTSSTKRGPAAIGASLSLPAPTAESHKQNVSRTTNVCLIDLTLLPMPSPRKSEVYVLPLAGSGFANYLAVRFLNPPNSKFPMSAGTFLVSLSSCPFIVTGMNGEALGSMRQRMNSRFNDTQNLQANPDPLKIPLKVGGFRRSSRLRRNQTAQKYRAELKWLQRKDSNLQPCD